MTTLELNTDRALDEEIAKLLAGDFDTLQDPYPLFARIRAKGPVYWYKGEMPIIANFADAAKLFRDSNHFHTYRGPERFDPDRLSDEDRAKVDEIVAFEALQMNEMNGDMHRRVRMVAQRAFPPNRIAALGEQVQSVVDDLLDEMAKEDVVDFMQLAYRLPLSVVSAFMGLDREQIDAIKTWGDAIASVKPFTGGKLPVEKIRAAHEGVRATQAYVRELIEEHRRNPDARTDFMESLLSSEETEKLTPEEMGGTISLIIYAGHESTTNQLGNSLFALLSNKDQWEALKAKPDLADNAVAELLRYNTPVQMMTRRAAEDVALSGVDIPKHTRALIFYGSVNRDEAEFPNGDALDITREKVSHMSFGFGVHVCIGSALARLEGRTVLETLARRFPDAELAVPASELQWNPHPVFRGLKSLPIRLGADRGRG
ncbi:cytochrome P450 [Oceanicola sp. 502str15]|uniref:cytochrome P450 n=1 Tax=Oceanicola sp. 502str15 TaxID=2696061 RepID=UPI0020948D70|nr:cytochrome P450 [Oceanicola sp. 502str15]MCO6385320.1 cytochrome P450 [Oceanicola sp. 502str15]